jgi:hypothetical protein
MQKIMKFSIINNNTMKNIFLIITLTSSLIASTPTKVFAINSELSSYQKNTIKDLNSLESTNYNDDDFYPQDKNFIRSRIRRVPCDSNKVLSNINPNPVGFAATSSMLLAMKPQPLPQCFPIRVPKA